MVDADAFRGNAVFFCLGEDGDAVLFPEGGMEMDRRARFALGAERRAGALPFVFRDLRARADLADEPRADAVYADGEFADELFRERLFGRALCEGVVRRGAI